MGIDVAFIIVMAIAVIKGFSKGFVVALFSFFAYIIGLAAALKLSVVVAHHFGSSASASGKWIPVLSFALVFIIVVFIVNICGRIIKKVVSLAMLGWIDRLAGILLYVMIYLLIFSVILFFAEKTMLIKPETIAASRVHGFVAPWAPVIIDNLGKILPVFRDLFAQLQIFFGDLGHKLAT